MVCKLGIGKEWEPRWGRQDERTKKVKVEAIATSSGTRRITERRRKLKQSQDVGNDKVLSFPGPRETKVKMHQ